MRSSRVNIKRAYEEASPNDGYRVLVDRLWPRGIRKEALAADEWIRPLAPSNELRRWFGHDPSRWVEFDRRYRRELSTGEAREALAHIVELARERPITLLYAAHDEEHNDAVVLKSVLEEHLRRARSSEARPTHRARSLRRTPQRPSRRAHP